MTDPRNAQPGSYWTSVRSNRPDAASPAGWFPPPAGEAAPPVRLREPARSDAASQSSTRTPYDVETRPTAMYRVPWQAARKHRGRPGGSAPRSAPAGPRADALEMRWPSLVRRGPRHIPVVGPTEALPGPADRLQADVPPAPAPARRDKEGQSGWQLAQRAWQANSADWEETAPPQPDYDASDPYALEPYALDSHELNTYPDDTYPDDTYPDDEAFAYEAPEEPANADDLAVAGDSRL